MIYSYRDNPDERLRLEALERALDPGSIELLRRLGVGRGWRCLEVAAGAGSVARWLANEGAEVAALDVDLSAFREHPDERIRLIEADIRDADCRPVHDLVHARCVLDVVDDPGGVMDAMAAATKPGGLLLLEEFDDVSAAVAVGEEQLHNAVVTARQQIWRERGLDPNQGRTLLRALRLRGFVGRGAEGRVLIREGGTREADSWRRSVLALRGALTSTGLVTNGDVDTYLLLLDNRDFSWFSAVIVAAWGRRERREGSV